EIYLDLGELASTQKFAQLALARDPCCESVHRLLMRCYASEHKQQLVSRQYSICVKALRDELGVTPGAETLRLFHDLTSASSWAGRSVGRHGATPASHGGRRGAARSGGAASGTPGPAPPSWTRCSG